MNKLQVFWKIFLCYSLFAFFLNSTKNTASPTHHLSHNQHLMHAEPSSPSNTEIWDIHLCRLSGILLVSPHPPRHWNMSQLQSVNSFYCNPIASCDTSKKRQVYTLQLRDYANLKLKNLICYTFA